MTPDWKSLIRGMRGKNRCDMTQLLANGDAFSSVVAAMASPFRQSGITKVAALDALGFPLGGAVALSLNAGLVLVRKGDKVAWPVESVRFTDYSGTEKDLEIAVDAVSPGDRLLVVDDWSETGEQLRAAISLLERLGGEVVGATCIHIESGVIQRTDLSKYRLHSLVDYGS